MSKSKERFTALANYTLWLTEAFSVLVEVNTAMLDRIVALEEAVESLDVDVADLMDAELTAEELAAEEEDEDDDEDEEEYYDPYAWYPFPYEGQEE